MPIDQDALDNAVEAAFTKPKVRTINGRTVVERDIADLLEARDAVASVDAASQPHRGLRFTKLISPGAG